MLNKTLLLILASAACGYTDPPTTSVATAAIAVPDLTWIHDLGADGNSVRGAMVEISGRWYGLAGEGGPNATANCNSGANWSTIEHTRHCPGALFSLSLDGSDYRTEHAFTQLDDTYHNVDGYHPYGSLVAGPGGWLYGVTQMGGTPEISGARGSGVLFRFSPAGGAFQALHHFYSVSRAFDGAYPMGTPAPLPDGRVCGTSKELGQFSSGAVWCWSEAGFDYAGMPVAAGGAVGGVTYAHGRLHGATNWGGAAGKGTYFTFDPDTLAIVVVASFPDYGRPRCCDDNTPIVSPLLTRSGDLLIAREFGGPAGTGLIVRLAEDGIHVLRELDDVAPNVPGPVIRFSNATGAMPDGLLTEGCDGQIYGSTLYGGAVGAGTIYQISGWNGMRLTVQHSFGFESGYPYGGLTRGSDCALWGTTFVNGRIFRFVPTPICL